MKRSPLNRKTPLVGKTPLKRTTPLKTKTVLEGGKPLKRSTPIKVKPPAPREDLSEAAAWHKAVTRSGKAVCAVCGASRGPGKRIQGHHVIKQQTLKRRATELGLDPATLLWDERAGMPVCEWPCHEHHTTRFDPIPRDRLWPSHWEFAEALGLTYVLEREYPDSGGGL